MSLIEVRQGNQARRGAVIGALVGTGLALAYVVGTAEQRPAGSGGAGAIIATGVTWGALGALIGTGFDSWKPVHLGVERL